LTFSVGDFGGALWPQHQRPKAREQIIRKVINLLRIISLFV
jgi:hypothetical protein